MILRAGPDAAPPNAGPDQGPVDAAPPDERLATDAAPVIPDGPPAPGTACTSVEFAAVFPPGEIGQTAAIELGALQGATCVDDICDPAPLYVAGSGLGVKGSSIGGDEFAGYDRVTLLLNEPTQLGYYVHRGQSYDSDLRVHHRVEAYLDDQLVLDMTIAGKEYTMAPMPLANRVIWSAVGEPLQYADSYTIFSVSDCP